MGPGREPGHKGLGPVTEFSSVGFLQSNHARTFRHGSQPDHRQQKPAAATPQPGAARCSDPAQRTRADPGRCRLGQDPCADDPYRLAAADRPGVTRRCTGGDLHQQGGQGNDDAPLQHVAGERARHVDRHLPWPVQPVPARPLQARCVAAEFPDSRYTGPVVGHQAADEAVQHRRRAFSGQTDAVVHWRLQGRGAAPEHGRGA